LKDYMIGEKQRNYNKLWRNLAIIAVIVLFGTTVAIREVYNQALLPVSASQQNIIITIPTGSTITEISNQLHEQGLIKHAWAFEWYVRNNNVRDKLQAGTYYLRPSQGVANIVDAITNGKVAVDLFTILPAQRLDQIQNALVNNGGFTAEEVQEALKPENYNEHPALTDKPKGASLEGYIFPESFQITTETTAQDIIRRSLDEFQKYLTPEIREAVNKQGLTLHEAITLASIVETEVSEPNDRKIVAQIFLSRLKNNIKLESDITVIYGALRDGLKEGLLKHDSVYNTYNHPGLPPGPISNVSFSSLSAVANPSNTDYLYFVSGDDGKTHFSHTLAEHERLTAEHCKKCGNID
jgi:UPF0755 protein